MLNGDSDAAGHGRPSGESLTRRTLLKGVGLSSVGALGARASAGAVERCVVGTRGREARRVARREASAVVREIDFTHHGTAVVGRFTAAAREALSGHPGVKYVEEDSRVSADQAKPWSVDRIDSDVAHDYGHTGGGVDVAVLDTGIDPDHPDLADNLGEGYAVVSCRSDCSASWDDDRGHGTQVAGIVGALDNGSGTIGTGPDVGLHAVKVLAEDGSGWDSDVAEGLTWTADQGYDVANMSLSGGGSSVLREAVEDAYARGVLLVGSAGNEGACGDCVGKPAKYDPVIAVSATDDADELAHYSSTGPEIEFAGTGHGTYTTKPGGGYEYFYGTSSAAPNVAGVGALLMAEGYTNVDARGRMRRTAEDIGLSSDEQGYGLIHAGNALDADASVAVSTEGASDVGSNSATLHGSLDELKGADSAHVAFQNRPASSSSWSRSDSESVSTTGSYSRTVSGLESGTDYEFRAIAWADDATDAGSRMTYRTPDSAGGEGNDDEDGDGCSGICVFGIDVLGLTWDVTWLLVDFLVDFGSDQFWLVGMVTDMAGNVVDTTTTRTSTGTLDGSMEFDIPDEYDEVRVTLEARSDDGVLDTETKTVEL